MTKRENDTITPRGQKNKIVHKVQNYQTRTGHITPKKNSKFKIQT